MDPVRELFRIMEEQSQGGNGERKKEARKPEEIMWRSLMYQGDVLVLDHAQNDYGKVLRFTMTAFAELVNNGVQDYRLTIQDKEGNLYFFAIGEKTQLKNYKKASDME